MGRPHGSDAAGTPLDLIGQPMVASGPAPGLVTRSTDDMSKAPHDGIYTLGDARYVVRGGDPLPDGAVMDGEPGAEPAVEPAVEPPVEPAPATRSKGAAPENRAKADEAETN